MYFSVIARITRTVSGILLNSRPTAAAPVTTTPGKPFFSETQNDRLQLFLFVFPVSTNSHSNGYDGDGNSNLKVYRHFYKIIPFCCRHTPG